MYRIPLELLKLASDKGGYIPRHLGRLDWAYCFTEDDKKEFAHLHATILLDPYLWFAISKAKGYGETYARELQRDFINCLWVRGGVYAFFGLLT